MSSSPKPTLRHLSGLRSLGASCGCARLSEPDDGSDQDPDNRYPNGCERARQKKHLCQVAHAMHEAGVNGRAVGRRRRLHFILRPSGNRLNARRSSLPPQRKPRRSRSPRLPSFPMWKALFSYLKNINVVKKFQATATLGNRRRFCERRPRTELERCPDNSGGSYSGGLGSPLSQPLARRGFAAFLSARTEERPARSLRYRSGPLPQRRGLHGPVTPPVHKGGAVLLGSYLNAGSERVMHWRKVPGKADGKAFYMVVSALTASAAVATALLVLHFHV